MYNIYFILNKNNRFRCCYVLTCIFCFYFFLNKSYSSEFYKVEQPYRENLKQYYTDIEIDTNNKDGLDLENVKKIHDSKLEELKQQELNTELVKILQERQKTFYADEQKQTKREEFLQNNEAKKGETNTKDDDNKDTKKVQKKSWLDNWLVNKDVKPFDYVGRYSAFKLLLLWPLGIKFSAEETRSYGNTTKEAHLFDGRANYGIMPGFYLSAGSDRFKYWRWEVELGYLPIRANKIYDVVIDNVANPYSNFAISNKELSVHILNINFNNYAQYAFFDKSIVAFIGVGIGLGYAWSWDSKISSNFILPVITGQIGINFMVSKTRKMSISYRLSYMNFKINNKYPFIDEKNYLKSNRSIVGGGISFKDLMVQGITIEYQFYTS